MDVLALHSWREGARRLQSAPPERRRTLDRVCEAIYRELRRRLGGPFTTAELVALYEEGGAWGIQLAAEIAPGDPWAWEASVVDAAFDRYLREARDFAGGRVVQ